MNINERFQSISGKSRYKRLEKEYKVDIFLGYDDYGNMSLVITEYGTIKKLKSSKFIDVKMSRKQNDQLVLSFNLTDNAYKAMFMVFCKDIINACESAGKDMAISVAITRWKYWKEMFAKEKADILSKQEVKGLIAELLELKNNFLVKYGPKTAVESWMGPMLGHKDFEVENTWYEIKSVTENAIQVGISSLEQLESDEVGHLVVIRLEETSAVAANSIRLNDLVKEIRDNISDLDVVGLFDIRLNNVGYEYNEKYDEYCFIYKGRHQYLVDEDFPKIKRSDLGIAVGNVKYSLILDCLKDSEEKI